MRIHKFPAKLLDNGQEALINSWIPIVIKGGAAKPGDYALLFSAEEDVDHLSDSNFKTCIIIRKKKQKMNQELLDKARKLGNIPVYFVYRDKYLQEYEHLLQSTYQNVSFTHKRGDRGDTSLMQWWKKFWTKNKGYNHDVILHFYSGQQLPFKSDNSFQFQFNLNFFQFEDFQLATADHGLALSYTGACEQHAK